MNRKDVKLLTETVMPIYAHSLAELEDRGLTELGFSPLGLNRSDRYYKEHDLFSKNLMWNFCNLVWFAEMLVQRISITNRIESQLTVDSQSIITSEKALLGERGEYYKIPLRPNTIKLLELMKFTNKYIDQVNGDNIFGLLPNNSINPYFDLALDMKQTIIDTIKIADSGCFQIDEKTILNFNSELIKKLNTIPSFFQDQKFKRLRKGFESKPRLRATSIKEFMRGLFVKYKTLNIVRFDLLYVFATSGSPSRLKNFELSKDKIVSQYLPEIRKFISLIKHSRSAELNSIGGSLVGYMVISDYNLSKGMHFHVMLFFSTPMNMLQKDHAVDIIDNVWRNLTDNNLGFAYPCNEASGSYRFSSIGTLNREGWFKDVDFQRAIYFFTRPSHFFKLDLSEHLFFKGEVARLK